MASEIRPPAVAGTFYPAEADILRKMVDDFLSSAAPVDVPRHPKAMIAPHAGYIYSGPTAGCAYALLEAKKVKRVVLLGPTHRVPVYGLALPDADAFATPLGEVPLDRDAMETVRAMPQVQISDAAHALEHSLEVQLPFLQRRLESFTLVPFAIGQATNEEVAEVLDKLWGDEDTLVVISSDLSHYLPYDVAREVDAETADMIVAMRPVIRHEQACGATPVNGLLTTAETHPLSATLVDLRNSGDTAGDKSQVVGYGAFAFTGHD
ncbi:MAG: AmmeMemoRadiSam system protein B [Mariprofundaceae bacterium]|nr:AmmeMemoRadiSam system protein B [Mariprofundaceae bacterium]